MYVTQLDVVNDCLATMGETPLNTLEDDHSFKAAALSCLDKALQIELSRGWWFNTEEVELTPDAVSRYIILPQDALSVKPLRGMTPVFAQRGKRLYNTAKNSYQWDNGVKLEVIRFLGFDDLPYHAADCIRYGAVMRFQQSFDQDNAKYEQLSIDYNRSRMELRAEDMRQRKTNMFDNPGIATKLSMIGPMRRITPR